MAVQMLMKLGLRALLDEKLEILRIGGDILIGNVEIEVGGAG